MFPVSSLWASPGAQIGSGAPMPARRRAASRLECVGECAQHGDPGSSDSPTHETGFSVGRSIS
eukprot:6186639-Pleurochrysis_carterae.AAC.1